MSFKIAAIAALVASIATASPLAARAGPGSVNFINKTPSPIAYALVPEKGYGSVTTGTIAAGATKNFPMSADKHGNSLKLTTKGNNPQASSDILQFEYTYNSDDGGIVTYDWSCVNCSPDPFTKYNRVITPADIGSQASCQIEKCAAGVDSDSCEYTDPTNYNPGTCATNGGVVLTAHIG